MENYTADNIESKGVKAHFNLDDNGLLSVSAVEAAFEQTISVEQQIKEEEEKKAKEGKKDAEGGDTKAEDENEHGVKRKMHDDDDAYDWRSKRTHCASPSTLTRSPAPWTRGTSGTGRSHCRRTRPCSTSAA